MSNVTLTQILFGTALVLVLLAVAVIAGCKQLQVLRGLTIALCVGWALMMVQIVLLLPAAPMPLVAASLFFPIYYTMLSFVLHRRQARRP